MSAELAARLTAAAAIQADFERERHQHAMAGGPLPDWATWAQRLSLALAGLLDQAGISDPAGGCEPGQCCAWCGASASPSTMERISVGPSVACADVNTCQWRMDDAPQPAGIGPGQ